LFFRRRNRPGRRFEAARFIAEQLQAPTTDRWLAATDARTARQKTQRAFAAELLCPIDVLRSELAGDYGDEALEEAAERFGISVRAVQSQLANHDLIPFDAVDTAQSAA
jgi:Zn-dependent peptidase ImmA (M78 family)